ncbi:MAG: LD-carboxypeptidase [Gemmatimonadota bacterium]|nr:LD-carboxypeptidase [Gemmatimonadota bacterium]
MKSDASSTQFRTFTEPLPLPAGSRVALIAPSGPLKDETDVAHAVETAQSLGWTPVVSPNVLQRTGYFAGDDDARASDLNAAIADTEIDGIWCLRGGYGAMRLLNRIDVSPLHTRPKPLIGYSDITALHSAWHRAGIISYHGPVARAELTPFSRESLQRAVILRGDSAGSAPDAETLREGRATGRLAGGNLALVAALSASAWRVDFRDAIAVFEDVNEPIFRIDRMLMQLRLAGALDGCRGLVFGHCTEIPVLPVDEGVRTLRDVIQETGDALGVPTLLGVPLGHIADQWTLPLGAAALLDARTKTLQVQRHARD